MVWPVSSYTPTALLADFDAVRNRLHAVATDTSGSRRLLAVTDLRAPRCATRTTRRPRRSTFVRGSARAAFPALRQLTRLGHQHQPAADVSRERSRRRPANYCHT